MIRNLMAIVDSAGGVYLPPFDLDVGISLKGAPIFSEEAKDTLVESLQTASFRFICHNLPTTSGFVPRGGEHLG